MYTFDGVVPLAKRNPDFYHKSKEEARDLLYLSMEERIAKIFKAWPVHLLFIEIAVKDFNRDYRSQGYYIEHDPLYKHSIEFNNNNIGQVALHNKPGCDNYDLRFYPMNDVGLLNVDKSGSFWLSGLNKEKARFVSKIILRFLMSEDNSKKRVPALINDYPEFVKYIFGIYGRS